MQSSYLIAIVGQTATGKSAFAVTLAKQLKSMESVQKLFLPIHAKYTQDLILVLVK